MIMEEGKEDLRNLFIRVGTQSSPTPEQIRVWLLALIEAILDGQDRAPTEKKKN
jgi:hypothetical protein